MSDDITVIAPGRRVRFEMRDGRRVDLRMNDAGDIVADVDVICDDGKPLRVVTDGRVSVYGS